MRTLIETQQLPRTCEEFQDWEPTDGYKYEWNDGEVIRFESMKQRHLLIIKALSRLFAKTKAYEHGGELVPEQRHADRCSNAPT